MPIECGFVTSRHVPVLDSLAAAAEMPIDCVEILMQRSGHRDTLTANADAICETLTTSNLDCLVHLPFRTMDIGSPYEHAREGAITELEANLRVADQLGARKAVIHPTSSADTGKRRALMTDALSQLHAVAADYGIELCAENMFGGYATIDELEHVLADTDASLTVDTGHARIEGYSAADTAGFLAANGDRVSHLHCNDTHGRSDDHLPFGAGTTDFETLLAPLVERDWDGTISVEVHTRNLDYIEHSCRQLDAMLTRLA
jgi:sugar phosphate isomerase/epimerase